MLSQNLPALSIHETPLGLLVTWTLPMVWTHMDRDQIFNPEVIKMGGKFTPLYAQVLKFEHSSAPQSRTKVDRPPILISDM